MDHPDRRSHLPLEFVLGGRRARFVWATAGDPTEVNPELGRIPAGLVIDHGNHTLVMTWCEVNLGAPHVVYPLDSLVPLTVGLPVGCPVCGVKGRIEQGAWLPAESGGVGG